MADTEMGIKGLLTSEFDFEEPFPRQGPPEPEHLKMLRLERERSDVIRILIAWLKPPDLDFFSDEEFVERFTKFANRKGIDLNNFPENIPYLLAGVLPEIREFSRPKGRPKKPTGENYRRYLAVMQYKIENPHDKYCDDVTVIRTLRENKHPLFSDEDMSEKTLQTSVSDGKKTEREASEKIEKLFQERGQALPPTFKASDQS